MTDPSTTAPQAVRAAAVTFLSFAAPISMLGVVWPDIRERFGQSLGTLGLVGLVYGTGRLSTALSGPPLVRRLGMGPSFVVALLVLTAAVGGTAAAPSWPVFLVAFALVGMASGSLDSLGAGFIASIRDVGSAGLVHGAYGVGSTLGPLLVLAAPGWRWALAMSAVLAGIAAVVAGRARQRWPAPDAARTTSTGRAPRRAVVVSIGALFAFVAFEVTAGQWAFTHLTEERGIGDTLAATAVALYWGGITVGRLALTRSAVREVVDRVRLARLALVTVAAILTIAVVPEATTPVALTVVGLALAPIVPSLFASTSSRVGGDHAQRLAVWQLAATNAGAISVPFLTGRLVDAVGPGVVVVVAAATAGVGVALLFAIDRLPDRGGAAVG